MDITLHKLDEIIGLLKEIKFLLEPKYQMTFGTYFVPNDFGTSDTNRCNCSDYKAFEFTAGWYCPVHGQCY